MNTFQLHEPKSGYEYGSHLTDLENTTLFNVVNKLCEPIKKYRLRSICRQTILKSQASSTEADGTVLPNRKIPKQYF
jgi:hypothetical protein